MDFIKTAEDNGAKLHLQDTNQKWCLVDLPELERHPLYGKYFPSKEMAARAYCLAHRLATPEQIMSQGVRQITMNPENRVQTEDYPVTERMVEAEAEMGLPTIGETEFGLSFDMDNPSPYQNPEEPDISELPSLSQDLTSQQPLEVTPEHHTLSVNQLPEVQPNGSAGQPLTQVVDDLSQIADQLRQKAVPQKVTEPAKTSGRKKDKGPPVEETVFIATVINSSFKMLEIIKQSSLDQSIKMEMAKHLQRIATKAVEYRDRPR